MFSRSDLLDHLTPVLFTFVVCLLLRCFRLTFWAHDTFGIRSSYEHVRRQVEENMNTHALRENARGRRRRSKRNQPKPVDEDLDADIKRIESFSLPFADQYQSPFFSVLPSEVRDLIYEFAFSDYEDLSKPYDLETCYRRPEYMGPRKTDTALLRTCQAVYEDAWYMPWTSAQHTFFLTADDRKPAKTTDTRQMARVSKLIEKLHPDAPIRRKLVKNIQIFSQLYVFEPGHSLNNVLSIPHFRPVHITITLRHTDLWFWESDNPIYINTPWVRVARFPPSTTRITFQLESLERRKPQVDHIIARARSEWFFTRSDDIHLICTTSPSELRWVGSSTWGQSRWVRDEDDREPGILHYYIASLVFTPADPQVDAEGYQHRNSSNHRIPHIVDLPADIVAKTRVASTRYASIQTTKLHELGGSSSTPASEAVKLVFERDLVLDFASRYQIDPNSMI